MNLFDFNVALGRVPNSRNGFSGAEELIAGLCRLGIGEALVYHRLAADADILLGNRLLLDALRGYPMLHSCWVMAPSAVDDLPDPGSWVAEAVRSGVCAVRLFPRHSLYTLADWCVGPLLAALELARVPLLLDCNPHHSSERVIPWDRVGTLCERHPKLPVVVIGTTVGETRDVLALLRRASNLYLEYHAFSLPDILGSMVREGLSDRLIFGTGLPLRAGECVVEQTVRSGLNNGDLSAVAAGNARRLLGLPESTAAPMNPYPRPSEVIDMHAHVGAWERTCTPVRTPDDVVVSMRRCGVEKMVVSSFAAIHGEMHGGNAQTAAIVREFPKRLYGYAVINPHYPEETESELKRCFSEDGGFVGLKLHCSLHGVQLQHAGYERAFSFAHERELPVLVHGGGEDRWTEVAERYPQAQFIMAHACAWDGVEPEGRELYSQVRGVENLYVDVAGSAAHRGALVKLVELVGVDKVLFGSDFPMFDLAFELGRVTGSGLDPAQQAAICAGNALRVFKNL